MEFNIKEYLEGLKKTWHEDGLITVADLKAELSKYPDDMVVSIPMKGQNDFRTDTMLEVKEYYTRPGDAGFPYTRFYYFTKGQVEQVRAWREDMADKFGKILIIRSI
jgi:hypothetical protein